MPPNDLQIHLWSPWLTPEMDMSGVRLQEAQGNNRWKIERDKQTFQELSSAGETEFGVQIKPSTNKNQIPAAKATF